MEQKSIFRKQIHYYPRLSMYCHRAINSWNVFGYLHSIWSLVDLIFSWSLYTMERSFDSVPMITTVKDSWIICVNVVWLWVTIGFNNSKNPFSLEMVLMDEQVFSPSILILDVVHIFYPFIFLITNLVYNDFFLFQGSKIHATVRRLSVYNFNHLLREGNVYDIHNFGVGPNSGNFRTTRHDFRLNFQSNTRVEPFALVSITRNLFNLVLFADILIPYYDTSYLTGITLTCLTLASICTSKTTAFFFRRCCWIVDWCWEWERALKRWKMSKVNIIELENEG